MKRIGMRPVYRLGLLLGGLLTLTGCFNRLDTQAIERELEIEIESQSRRLSLAEVRCPRDIFRKAGAYFRCVGYLRPEGEFTINVVQQDSQGSIEWDVPNSQVILNMAKVEDKLQEEFAKTFSRRATLDCGEMYRVNQPGEQVACQVVGGVTLGQETVTALLVKIDPEGNLNWYEVREAIAPGVNASTATPGTPAAGTPQAAGGAATEAAPSAAPTGETERPRGIAGSRRVEPPEINP